MKKGFTIVELLVVLAIAGVLIALLLPAINAALQVGKRNSPNPQSEETQLLNHGFSSVGILTWNTHQYLIFNSISNNYYGNCVVHDPDCPCHTRQVEKVEIVP